MRRYLDERGVNDPALDDGDAGELRRQLIAGVCQVIDEACEQPVVLLLDDAHWADELTHAVLDELIRRSILDRCTPLHVRHLHAEVLAHIGSRTNDPMSGDGAGCERPGFDGRAIGGAAVGDAAANGGHWRWLLAT